MKLLIDANLSRKLVALLDDQFPGSAHVSRLGPDPTDETIWDYAKTSDFIIVSKRVIFIA